LSKSLFNLHYRICICGYPFGCAIGYLHSQFSIAI
jgi:hypothetical protein